MFQQWQEFFLLTDIHVSSLSNVRYSSFHSTTFQSNSGTRPLFYISNIQPLSSLTHGSILNILPTATQFPSSSKTLDKYHHRTNHFRFLTADFKFNSNLLLQNHSIEFGSCFFHIFFSFKTQHHLFLHISFSASTTTRIHGVSMLFFESKPLNLCNSSLFPAKPEFSTIKS